MGRARRIDFLGSGVDGSPGQLLGSGGEGSPDRLFRGSGGEGRVGSTF